MHASYLSDFIDILRIFLCHIFFAFGRQSRLPKYDYDRKDPYNRGLLFRDEEKLLEYPVPQSTLESVVSRTIQLKYQLHVAKRDGVKSRISTNFVSDQEPHYAKKPYQVIWKMITL